MTKLSYIEEVKDSVQKRYNSLKTELKKDGNLTDIKKQKSVIFTKEMMEHANKHYYEVKHEVDQSSKTNRVAKQISRNMASIEKYKDKIYALCGSMPQDKKEPSPDSKEQSNIKPKFIPKSYPRAWEIELTDDQRENLQKSIAEDEKKYKELGKKLAKDNSFSNPFNKKK